MTGIVLLGSVPGCADGPSESRQTPADKALSDPMNYGPKAEDYAARAKAADTKNRSATTSDPDGLKRDLDHVFNP